MAIGIFWIFIGLAAASYFGYPAILTLIAYIDGNSRRREDIEPRVTLIIPAYNEQEVVKGKIENALELDYPKDKFEILLVLDGCTDRTKDIAEGFCDSRIRIIEQLPRKGKAAALNLAVPQACGEIIVFTDANSLYNRDAVKKLVRNFADEGVGCVCGELKYVNESLVGEGEDLYWRYEQFIKIRESRLNSLLVVNGSIYAIRKCLYEPVEEMLADDFVVPMRIARKGYGLIYEPEAITVEKTASSAKEGFNQKSRIIAQGLKATFAIASTIFSSRPLRVFQFIFHKLIRWFIPIFLICIFISNLFLLRNTFYRIVFFGQMLFYLFAAMGYILQEKRIKIRVFKVPFYFCIVNLASLVGLIRFISGETEAIWEKAPTTRR